MDVVRDYWPIILIAIAIAIAVILLARPRQRVRLTDDSTPVRPHMTQAVRPEGRGLAGEAAAATSDLTGAIIGAPVHRELSGVKESADDFSRMKGVGPKFATALHGLGFVRFDQLAHLTATEIERLDAQLGAFSGRITRDRVVEQAAYLARNDVDGYEQTFGKL
jgi:predicted flap endonuclease-1-like 5' DNA nuclease